MTNKPLIVAISTIGLAYLSALVIVIVLYDGPKLPAIGALSVALGVLLPALLGLKQSTDNAVKLDTVVSKIDENTAKTEETHGAVNGQMADFRTLMRDFYLIQADMAAAKAKAAGIVEGRTQAETEVRKQEAFDAHQKNAADDRAEYKKKHHEP